MILPPHPVETLPLAVVNAAIHGLHVATASRYLSVAGLAALLYDHCLTFGDEINLICTAPRSFLKWVFLTNHYLVEMCLIAVAIEISGYSSVLRDNGKFLMAIASYALISTFLANLIGFLRVIVLWDNSPRIMLVLTIALTVSFLTSMGGTVASIIYFDPDVKYEPSLDVCYLTKSAKPIIVLWANPVAFDITVLALIIFNSLSNPRDTRTTLRRILHRDGIMFFLLVASIRVMNLVFVVAAGPVLTSFPVYFSWAVITLACRRLLFHIHSYEQEAAHHNDLFASRHSSMVSDYESAIELHSHRSNCH